MIYTYGMHNDDQDYISAAIHAELTSFPPSNEAKYGKAFLLLSDVFRHLIITYAYVLDYPQEVIDKMQETYTRPYLSDDDEYGQNVNAYRAYYERCSNYRIMPQNNHRNYSVGDSGQLRDRYIAHSLITMQTLWSYFYKCVARGVELLASVTSASLYGHGNNYRYDLVQHIDYAAGALAAVYYDITDGHDLDIPAFDKEVYPSPTHKAIFRTMVLDYLRPALAMAGKGKRHR